MESNLLEIRHLKTYYLGRSLDVKAVDGLDLVVGKKQAVGIVGESGCGKTTVAWSIMRLIPNPGKIVAGNIIFNGKNLLEVTEEEMRKIRGKHISMVFQSPLTYLNPVMKIKDQIAENLETHSGGTKNDNYKKVVDLLAQTQIPSPEIVADYYPHQLSGGMRQRVLIAMAISCKPALLIADEPTTALDTTVQMGILELFKDLKKNEDLSILIITHDFGIVADLCDELYIMYAGKIVEYGDIFKIFESPSHPYTVGLIESTLSVDEFKEHLQSIPGSIPDMRNPPTGCRFHPRCKHVSEICKKEEPPKTMLDSEHGVSCWLFGQG